MIDKFKIVVVLFLFMISCKWTGEKRDICNIGIFATKDSSITVINDTSQIKHITASNCFWIPSKSQLDLIDSIINIATNDTSKVTNKRFIIRDFKKYYRQYVCYKDKNNDSIIYVNAFCQIPTNHFDSAGINKIKKFDWKNNFILMDDGGSCYWQIKINFTTKKYFDFMINGDA